MRNFEYYYEKTKQIKKPIKKRSAVHELVFSEKAGLKIILKYLDKRQNLENFDGLMVFIRKFFVFMKKMTGKYPQFDEIYIAENRVLSKLNVKGYNKSGNWITLNDFKKINYWTLFHEMIHIYNVDTYTGFIAEGLADFLSYLFISSSNFAAAQSQVKGELAQITSAFSKIKNDYPLYDSMKKDYNKNVDIGADSSQTYAKSFLFWKMIHDKLGLEPVKEAFRKSLKNKKLNAVNVKNIIKKYTKEPMNYMKGWIVNGEYQIFPELKL